MAVLRFSDGKSANVNSATGLRIWQILNDQVDDASDKEMAICDRVHKIYLNWRNAPDDYIKAHFDRIAPIAISAWMVESTPIGSQHQHTSIGIPTRPEPGDNFNREFCKKWGLLKNGVATPLARRYM